MGKRILHLTILLMVFIAGSCVKETYNMDMLSKSVHLSPTLAISAIKGDISISDLVTPGDTVVFDPDNFIRIIFKKDSIIDMSLDDFSPFKGLYLNPESALMQSDFTDTADGIDNNKGTLGQLVATIEPYTFNLEIEDILDRITGDLYISDPIIRFNYTNSFVEPIEITINAIATRGDASLSLDLAPFTLSHPADEIEHEVSDTYIINKNISKLDELISMPPEKINFSGSAVLTIPDKKGFTNDLLQESNHLLGSLEFEIPLEFSISDIQFADTLDNFLADAFEDGGDLNWEDFEMFRVDFEVENGFPLGVSLSMDLYDSLHTNILSSIDASEILKASPIDAAGKAKGTTTSTTSIEFTRDFFDSINVADNIILRFKLKTTDNSIVKIYSDYRINFKASLLLKPDIKFNLK